MLEKVENKAFHSIRSPKCIRRKTTSETVPELSGRRSRLDTTGSVRPGKKTRVGLFRQVLVVLPGKKKPSSYERNVLNKSCAEFNSLVLSKSLVFFLLLFTSLSNYPWINLPLNKIQNIIISSRPI